MKQFAVIGLGRFGTSVATSLYGLGHEVLAVDVSAEKVADIADHVTHAVQVNIDDESAVAALGLRNFDCAIVAIGTDLQASILVTMLCKEAGVPVVVSKAQSDLHAKILTRVGADKVVFPERDMGSRTAQSLVSESIVDYIELSPDYSMVELAIPRAWVGHTLREVNVRVEYGVNIIGIRTAAGTVNIAPQGHDSLCEGDIAIVVGSNKDITRLQSRNK